MAPGTGDARQDKKRGIEREGEEQGNKKRRADDTSTSGDADADGYDTEWDACCGCNSGEEAAAEGADGKEDEPREMRIDVLQLHPTQLAVGMYQVSFKCGRLKAMFDRDRKEGSSSLEDYLREHPVPVVRGPKGQLYLTDHHHLAAALVKLETQVGEGRVPQPHYGFADKKLGRHWHEEDEETPEFWQDLLDHKCAWAGSKDGVQLTPQELVKKMPKDVTGLKDDPYRSLAAYVRYAKGYKKPKPQPGKGGQGGVVAGGGGGGNEDAIFFVEFKWANFLRRHLEPPLPAEPDNKQLLALAVELAGSEAAAGLPGYKGAKKEQTQAQGS